MIIRLKSYTNFLPSHMSTAPLLSHKPYGKMSLTTPAPTVRPPTTLHPPQQPPNLVPCLTPVQHLAKPLHPRRHRLLRRFIAHNLHRIPPIDHPALHPPRRHRAPPRDGEDIFHRHQKRPLHRPL